MHDRLDPTSTTAIIRMPSPAPGDRPPTGGDAATYRDLQRSALQSMVRLAGECAEEESRIEQQHEARVEKARQRLDRRLTQIGQRYTDLLEEVRCRHTDRISRIHYRCDMSVATQKSDLQVARQRTAHEYDNIRQELNQKLQYAAWLADSVLEAAENQIHKDSRKSQEQLAERRQMLDEKAAQAQALMDLYGVPVPQDSDAQTAPAQPVEMPDADAAFAAQVQSVDDHLARLRGLRVPRLFVGIWPYLIVILLLFLTFVGTQAVLQTTEPQWNVLAMSLGGMLAAVVILGAVLRVVGRSHVRATWKPLAESLAAARAGARAHGDQIARTLLDAGVKARRTREREVQKAKDALQPVLNKATRKRDSALRSAQETHDRLLAQIEQDRRRSLAATNQWRQRMRQKLRERHEHELQAARQQCEDQIRNSRMRSQEERAALERRLSEAMAWIQAPLNPLRDRGGGPSVQIIRDWHAVDWDRWVPPMLFPAAVRFGEFRVDLKPIARSAPVDGKVDQALPTAFPVPASLAFPGQASLLVQAGLEGRAQAISTLQMVMTRLLTSLPPGRVHFTLIDPVGLGQNFAGFMHLADHDDALVGGRIWTEADQIEQRLADLTEHMETVIQKYLRNEFESIDEYNAQAGELAEPYRFLVISDFPSGFTEDGLRRLASIVNSGPRCGIYTLIYRDTRLKPPEAAPIQELESHSANLVQEGDGFWWKDEVFGQFPLTLDEPPTDQTLIRIMEIVGRHALQSKRVEVPFETIAPPPDRFWSGSTLEDLRVPIGRMGATRLQALRLGRGVAQHGLIAGKTGAGKSTLLHVLITNLAMWYHPDEMEFYLVDFKKGVEFKTYATHQLPHARAVAVESDREFGLSVLQRLDAELERRGALFRRAGVQDLAAYRRATGKAMPRTLLIIDEFQEFFSEDDRLAQDAGLLLDRLVRQGRAFGIHVLLGSQTIGGTGGLARSTVGQMSVRIALQTSEADSQLILGDNNLAARLLSRPGEAIYNDAGGLVEANSPFQVAWLPDEQRERYLRQVSQRAQAEVNGRPAPIVFEGNVPSDIRRNERLTQLLAAAGSGSEGGKKTPPDPVFPSAAEAWLGEPVAIKAPTSITFRRQSGANALVVGQQEELALAMLVSTMIGLAAQHPPGSAEFVVLDGTPGDSPLAGFLDSISAVIGHPARMIPYRAVPEAISELNDLMQQRQSAEHPDARAVYVLIYALQRYRVLRRQEESFSFSMSEEEKATPPDKQFADLLREGPPLGIHFVTWCDTPAAVERTLDRNTLREFDHRVLFQMSAADSSNLIDSPAANKLGPYRALAYSEEQGVMEKFRPYALPDAKWLEQVKAQLARRAVQTDVVDQST